MVEPEGLESGEDFRPGADLHFLHLRRLHRYHRQESQKVQEDRKGPQAGAE